MKSLLLFFVLAALTASYDAAAIQEKVATRANLNIGYVGPYDRLLYRNYFSVAPRPNSVQYQDIVFRGNANTRISAIRAIEVGATQFATAYIVAGGLGQRDATVRLTTARGYGYYYMVEFWGS